MAQIDLTLHDVDSWQWDGTAASEILVVKFAGGEEFRIAMFKNRSRDVEPERTPPDAPATFKLRA